MACFIGFGMARRCWSSSFDPWSFFLPSSIALIPTATRHSSLELGYLLFLIVVAFLALIPSYASSTKGDEMVKANVTSIDYTLYHHSDSLLQEVKALATRHPKSMMVQTWKSEVDGYASDMVVVTIEHGANSFLEDKKFRILLSFGQHGRELITCEVALRLLSTLVGESSLPAFNADTVKQKLRNLIIKVVPMENVNGRKAVEGGNFCERKNGRGVDINRNWSVDWGKKEKDFDPAEEFPGTAPFSEPETRIMRALARSFKPHLWINVHSGMEAMFMPYDYKSELPDAIVAKPMKQLLQKLNRIHCNNSCVIGPGGGSVGYLAHGTATDYMYEAVKVPLAFTFEIYGDSTASSDDCFPMFNPTNLAIFESTVSNWCAAFFTIFIDLQIVLNSWPSHASTWGNREYDSSIISNSNTNEVVISMDPLQESKHLYESSRLSSLEFALKASSIGKGEWANEARTIFEFTFIFSISILVFICYVIFRCRTRLLARHRMILPMNFCVFS